MLRKRILQYVSNDSKYRFIHINPGFVNLKGHHYHLNKILQKLVQNDGGEFMAFVNKEFEQDHLIEVNTIPVFTYNTWNLINKGESESYFSAFTNELNESIHEVNNLPDQIPNIFFFYLADIRHIPCFLSVALENFNSRNSFLLNMFHASREFFPNTNHAPVDTNDALCILTSTRHIRQNLNLQLSVESNELKTAFEEQTGESPLLLPLISSILYDEKFAHVIERKHPPKKEIFNITNLTSSEDRGADIFIRFLQHYIRQIKQEIPVHFIVRINDQLSDELKKQIENYSKSIEILYDDFSEEEYINVLSRSNILLLPYQPEYYFSRTSGLLVDALLAGIPVIASKNTWAGRLVESYGNGETFNNTEPEALYNALHKVCSNVDFYLKNATIARQKWLKYNSPENFLKLAQQTGTEQHKQKHFSIDFAHTVTDLLKVLLLKNSHINTIVKDHQNKKNKFENEIDKLQNKTQKLKNDNSRLKARNDQLENRLKVIYNSKSWKISQFFIKIINQIYKPFS